MRDVHKQDTSSALTLQLSINVNQYLIHINVKEITKSLRNIMETFEESRVKLQDP